MRPSTRLWLIAGIIVLSAVYAVLVVEDRNLAAAISSGYVALLLTVTLVLNVWKKP